MAAGGRRVRRTHGRSGGQLVFNAQFDRYVPTNSPEEPKILSSTDAELALLNLKQDNFHGDWNYTVLPTRKKT